MKQYIFIENFFTSTYNVLFIYKVWLMKRVHSFLFVVVLFSIHNHIVKFERMHFLFGISHIGWLMPFINLLVCFVSFWFLLIFLIWKTDSIFFVFLFIVIFFSVYLLFRNDVVSVGPYGGVGSLYFMASYASSIGIITVMLRIAMETRFLECLSLFTPSLSFNSWIIFFQKKIEMREKLSD